MTRIVRTSHRYKRPPGKRKPVAIEGPAVITTASKRRRAAAAAKAALAASIELAPGELEQSPVPAVSRTSGAAAKSAIVTVRRKAARIIPPDLLPETPEEHQRRGDAADAMWRELVCRLRGRT
jgi:hypothetical protein